jgi:ankyrin repeat protein
VSKSDVVPTNKKELDELQAKDDEGQTKLHHAIKNNNVAEVERLLSLHQRLMVDVNVKDLYGWTPLHCAVSNCTGTDSDDEILRMLLEFPTIEVNVENQVRTS